MRDHICAPLPKQPYYKHLAEVAALVGAVPHSSEMVAAVWLHDTIQDTGTSYDALCEAFGRVYLAEKAALLEVLDHGDALLMALAVDILEEALGRLG